MNLKAGNETILVTGAAGFIGAALVKALLDLAEPGIFSLHSSQLLSLQDKG
mgnify:CR=1 FL=1